MKTIIRSSTIAAMIGAMFALGAVAGMAQTPCDDNAAITALRDKITANYPAKNPPDQRQQAVDAGKDFLTKYSTCDTALADWLTPRIPKWETEIKQQRLDKTKADLALKFNNAFKARNWDDVFAAGKDLMAMDPEGFRGIELALGSIGWSETGKNPRNFKYNDQSLVYAKQSLADLAAGKAFAFFGVSMDGSENFKYANADEATAYMNFAIGYIYTYDKKYSDSKEGVTYLYKAAQSPAGSKEAEVYAAIGSYYYDQALGLNKEIAAMKAAQNASDTDDVKTQKIEAINAKGALLNGVLERTMDAYGRALNASVAAKNGTSPSAKAYQDVMNKKLKDLYSARFDKTDGLDAWVKTDTAKPLPDPSSTIDPIVDKDQDAATDPPKPGTTPKPPIKPPTPGTKPQSMTNPGGKSVGTNASNGKNPKK